MTDLKGFKDIKSTDIKMSTLSTDGSGEGNSNSSPSKRPTASKYWVFTFNNYSKEEVATLDTCLREKCEKFIYQPELSESGTRHLQGFVKFNEKNRPLEAVPIKGIHWAKMKKKSTEDDNYRYCSKEDTKNGDTVIFNMTAPKDMKPIYYENIEEFYDWELELLEEIKVYKENRTIIWRYETKGLAGKTTFLKYLYTHQNELNIKGMVVVSGKSADMKNCIVDYFNKMNETPGLVVVNIPRSTNMDYVSYTGIEELKDMFFYSGKYEGGMICGPRPMFIVMSNEEPIYDKMSSDRWDVKNIGNEKNLDPEEFHQ